LEHGHVASGEREQRREVSKREETRSKKEMSDEPKVDENLFRVRSMSRLDEIELVCDIPGN